MACFSFACSTRSLYDDPLLLCIFSFSICSTKAFCFAFSRLSCFRKKKKKVNLTANKTKNNKVNYNTPHRISNSLKGPVLTVLLIKKKIISKSQLQYLSMLQSRINQFLTHGRSEITGTLSYASHS